jgi:hypothetical protein
VTTFAITGHQDLSAATQTLIERGLLRRLRGDPQVRGLSSLAVGADQIFARCVRRCGGSLIVVVPAADYADGLPPAGRREYDRLLSEASEVLHLPFKHAGEEAYWAAGRAIVDRCDELLAVWDGKAAGGLGGTGDVVRYARARRVPVQVVWPDGAQRS